MPESRRLFFSLCFSAQQQQPLASYQWLRLDEPLQYLPLQCFNLTS
jgi:hypothetical protein